MQIGFPLFKQKLEVCCLQGLKLHPLEKRWVGYLEQSFHYKHGLRIIKTAIM